MPDPKKSSDTANQTPQAAAADTGGPDEADAPNAFITLAHFQALSLRTLLGQQREVMNFLGRRYDEELKLFDRIMAAGEPQAILAAVADFYRDAAKDYTAELGRAVERAPAIAAEAQEKAADTVRNPVRQPAPATSS